MSAQVPKPKTVAAEALLTAADTVERWVDNEREHYAGTEHDAIIKPQQTFDRAFNAAYDYNMDADSPDVELVEDIFSEPMIKALNHDLAGKEAAEFYRNQAKEMLNS